MICFNALSTHLTRGISQKGLILTLINPWYILVSLENNSKHVTFCWPFCRQLAQLSYFASRLRYVATLRQPVSCAFGWELGWLYRITACWWKMMKACQSHDGTVHNGSIAAIHQSRRWHVCLDSPWTRSLGPSRAFAKSLDVLHHDSQKLTREWSRVRGLSLSIMNRN